MFSKKGLRTLCLAMKIIDAKEYEQFQQDMNDTLGKDGTEKLQNDLIDKMEKHLTLIGATAVED